MDHKEQHHQHHLKEREREKKEQKAYETQQEKYLLPIHPKWFFVLGVIMVALALLVWSLI
jgi:hypothetical protein